MCFPQMSTAPDQRVFFGSCQERKLFPLHYAPNRLVHQMSRHTAPHVGPGFWYVSDRRRFGTILYDLQTRPVSKRGLGLSARTAARFLPCIRNLTPSPQQYQNDQSQSRIPPTGKTPFNSTAKRFKSMSSSAEASPGKVSWPMRFGSPDWSSLPQLEKKSLRLNNEKEFLKQRTRVAYLSLYY
uniref:Primary cilia formation n=1 Tax=Mastacembelus armatus TaxID=205130 RepID=A0A3Q3L3I3_9TELE